MFSFISGCHLVCPSESTNVAFPYLSKFEGNFVTDNRSKEYHTDLRLGEVDYFIGIC